MGLSARPHALVGAGRQHCVQHVHNKPAVVQPSRIRVRCVKPDCVYASKQPEHQRRELEPRSALALAIEASGRSAADFRGLSTSLPQPAAPRRLRVAVDVDEGEHMHAVMQLLTPCMPLISSCLFRALVMRNPPCCLFAAVLGRFVYALNIFCKEAYCMDYDVSDYCVYEFAKVGQQLCLPSSRCSASPVQANSVAALLVSRLMVLGAETVMAWQPMPQMQTTVMHMVSASVAAVFASTDLELLPGPVKPHRARVLQVRSLQ